MFELSLWGGMVFFVRFSRRVDARKTHSSFPYKVEGHNITRCELWRREKNERLKYKLSPKRRAMLSSRSNNDSCQLNSKY